MTAEVQALCRGERRAPVSAAGGRRGGVPL